MKRVLSALAALALLFACSPENNPDNGGNNNNGGGNTQPTVVELTGIALTEHEITLEKGGNKVLEVKFTPENATNTLLTWVSSNTSIVTVTDGVVVGVAPGSTEIIVKSGNLTDMCQVTVVISATSVSLDQPELTLAPGEIATLKATVLPDDSTDEVEWSSSDETVASVQDGVVSAVAEGSATITAKAGEKTATCSVKVENKVPEGAVDLGIEMTRADGTTYKLYWAECNLGAEKPEDYGDYYAWGETETKEDYSWSTYKYANGGYNKLTKYCPSDRAKYWDGAGAPDNKTVLEPEDDVAHVKLGGNWRMPTDEEWTEIRTKCTWTWTTQNGVNGRLVTASNGNSIFLPAAGNRYGSSRDEVGSHGYYWSSSLYTDLPNDAWRVYFFDGDVCRYYSYGRYFGFSIRPVSE